MNILKLLKSPALFSLLLIPLIITAQSAKKDSFFVANWNLENLFDPYDDTLKNDNEFLPKSAKGWNKEKYQQKLTNLSAVIRFINSGKAPDIIGLEEVENINVVKELIYKLRERDYIVCHRDSPDERGIDVALMYDRNIFMIENISKLHVELPDHTPTRDILHTVLIHKKSKNKIHVYVNHWPSRIGGEEKSETKRNTAAEVLKSNLDSLFIASPNSSVIILGDFNDEPDNESILKVLGAEDFECAYNEKRKDTLLNLAAKKFHEGEGSYLYSGKWDMIDQIIISSSLLDKKGIEYNCNSFQIIKPQFMIDPKSKKGGPLPTYKGNKYIGGYSDHYPVGAKFYVTGKN